MKNETELFSKLFITLLSISLFLFSEAQVKPKTPAVKPQRANYSFLNSYPERDTKIIGTIARKDKFTYTQFYPKDGLFSDSFHTINTGAKFELLNDSLPLSKNFDRILIKLTSNPPDNKYVGDKGWILIDHTTLFDYLDRSRNRVDTNLFVNKYIYAAAKCRSDAEKAACAANKKCNLEWARYYDCMIKGTHYNSLAICPYPKCAIEDCPDNK